MIKSHVLYQLSYGLGGCLKPADHRGGAESEQGRWAMAGRQNLIVDSETVWLKGDREWRSRPACRKRYTASSALHRSAVA